MQVSFIARFLSLNSRPLLFFKLLFQQILFSYQFFFGLETSQLGFASFLRGFDSPEFFNLFMLDF